MMSAKQKIDLYDLSYTLIAVTEDGQALFESDSFGCWFANENPDIMRYLSSQLDDPLSVRVIKEAPFSVFMQSEDLIIQSVERLK